MATLIHFILYTWRHRRFWLSQHMRGATPFWAPGVTRVTSTHNGGTMTGGPARFVWHTYECGPATDPVAAAKSLIKSGNEVHFVLNIITGQIVQILPVNVAGRGLRHTASQQTNRMGTRCIQVEVLAFAAKPFTAYVTPKGWAAIRSLVAFGEAHGVPRVWPAGKPPIFIENPPRNIPVSARSATVWGSKGGHYGHSQVPQQTHGDPGAIDVAKIVARPTQPVVELTDRQQVMLQHLRPIGANPKVVDEQVRTAQAVLRAVVDSDLEADGRFGDVTTAALKHYQAAYRLPTTGKLDAPTWRVLVLPSAVAELPTLSADAAHVNAFVRRGQAILRVRGASTLVVDGVFGNATKSALLAFQRRHGIPQTGRFDWATWTHLYLP